jgi:hypothetical protein
MLVQHEVKYIQIVKEGSDCCHESQRETNPGGKRTCSLLTPINQKSIFMTLYATFVSETYTQKIAHVKQLPQYSSGRTKYR